MTHRAGSRSTFGAIMAIAAGVALAGCIGQVSAHPIGPSAPDAAPIDGAAPAERPGLRVATVTEDRNLDGVDRAAYLVAAEPIATTEAPPFVCQIMDMGAGGADIATTDGAPSNEAGTPRGTNFAARREAFLAAAP
jgi:hypothetical protein